MISDTATVKDSRIGEGTKIWEFANIYGCEIGCNCNIGSYVEIQNDVCMGDRVVVSSHSFICSLVTIEDDVFIGPNVTFTNDNTPQPKQRRGEFVPQKTVVKQGAIIGANATILPGLIIGEGAQIAAGAVVTKDVLAYTLVMGVPARIIKHLKGLV